MDNRDFFKGKDKVYYLTSSIGKTGELYLKPFKEILDSSFKWGKIIYKGENYRKQIGKYGLELKEIRDSLENKLDNNVLRQEIDKFLLSHNTLSLTTGSSLGLRSTPIEYSFIKGNIYLFSEGGEKFAHLLLSDKVCISIYDNYTGFNKLNGMQIKGKAEILDKDAEEYLYILKEKGLSSDKISAFGIDMNIIKVIPEITEFLSSDLKKYNVSLKQILK